MKYVKTIEELLGDGEEFKDFKLCFIGAIPETVMDYDEYSKAYMSQPGFSWEAEKEIYGYCSPNLRMIDVPNPEYVSEEKEMYAYFTPLPPEEVDGDEWDSLPYESYDDWGLWSEPYVDCDVLLVPFYVPGYGISHECVFPQGCRNFTAKDVNLGAIPWLYARGRGGVHSVIVSAGINPYQFILYINDIK